MRIYNFSPGPSMIFEDVLLEAQKDFPDYNGTGMAVMEMSHRSAAYDAIHTECISLFKELLDLPEGYSVLLIQGGASMQFEAVPLNLLGKTGKADYINTGNFAKKAYKEAMKYGDIACAGSSEDKTYTYIPDFDTLNIRDDIDYLHITSNNTIFGTKFNDLPKTNAPIVCDMSSNILSEVMDFSKYGVVYAGAQKNIGPSGLTVVIVRDDLLNQRMDICPTMLSWENMQKNDSLYNTPPTFSIFMAMLTLRHLKKMGGIKEIQKINEYKAGLLYDYIDNSDFYTNSVVKADRSLMNVPFVCPNADLDKKFIAEAAEKGLVSLKGHRLVGGMRASIYNAMPVEGVKALIEFMENFKNNNK